MAEVDKNVLSGMKAIDAMVLDISQSVGDKPFPYLLDGKPPDAVHREAALGAVLAMTMANPAMVAVGEMIEKVQEDAR